MYLLCLFHYLQNTKEQNYEIVIKDNIHKRVNEKNVLFLSLYSFNYLRHNKTIK